MADKFGFMNFLRGKVTESAASTYTENEIDTNLSAERGVMMEIHSVEFDFTLLQLAEIAAAGEESLAMQLVRESKSAIVNVDDPDLLCKRGEYMFRSAAIGTDAGPLWYKHVRPIQIIFPKPLPYVKPSIVVGILGSDASAVNTGRFRIGYTLRKINKTEFLELLIALQ